MADNPRKYKYEDDDHNGYYAKRYDHIHSCLHFYFFSEEPWAAFSISSSAVSRFAPS